MFYKEYPGVEFRLTDIEGVEIGSNGIITFEHKRTGKRVFTTGTESYGYKRFTWRIDGKCYGEFTHRLVAKAFVENPAKHKLVLHRNDIKSDNRAENLYWGDHYMNRLDMNRNGIKPNSGNRPLSAEAVEELRGLRAEGLSTYKLAELFNCSRRLVQKVLNREVWA